MGDGVGYEMAPSRFVLKGWKKPSLPYIQLAAPEVLRLHKVVWVNAHIPHRFLIEDFFPSGLRVLGKCFKSTLHLNQEFSF